MSATDTEYLTTREVAALLRIKERKVYDLAASGRIPCSKVMGKLLFPRLEVEAWVAGAAGTTGGVTPQTRPAVLLGSYEPLLEWALRESGCELATLLDGSMDGVERFARGEGVATGLHVYAPDQEQWNVPLVQSRFANSPVVLVEFAWRERGLVVAPAAERDLADPAALSGRRVVPRQAGAGSQVLLLHLIEQAGLAVDDVHWTKVARTESEAALAVLEGKADAALGLRAMAQRMRLGFVPLISERYDLLIDRRDYFEPPLQALFRFFASPAFRDRAGECAGYDIGGLGRVLLNGD